MFQAFILLIHQIKIKHMDFLSITNISLIAGNLSKHFKAV